MTELFIGSDAEADFTEALNWYAERSVSAASEFDTDVDNSLAAIVANPEQYPKCDDRHHFYLMCRFPFQIIYRFVNQRITIIAFAHTSRQPFWAKR